MRYVFSAPNLTRPTVETVESVSKRRFKSIQRLISKNSEQRDDYLEVSVKSSGDEYEIKAKLHAFEVIVANAKHRDLRIAIRNASQQLKRQVRDKKT